ncbi:MAG: imidazoleglycerol-phosphate dehydratase HisB [Pyrinomonadaceae bacterium]
MTDELTSDNAKREATVSRRTNETDIRVRVTLDGSGESKITTGIGFLDHMLNLFARHGLFDLEISCQGDLGVDDHHSVEDIAITLGLAFKEALGAKTGIARFGSSTVPMDETLCRSVVDLSGRSFLVYEAPQLKRQSIGNFSVEMVEHFWRSFADSLKCNLHIDVIRGRNAHHIIEASFKATALALRVAVTPDPRIIGILSTKGTL